MLCIFVRDEKEPACNACKNLCQQKWPTVAVTTAEMHHPLPLCVHICCLVSRNIQQTLKDVSGCHFCSAWRNWMTPFCFTCTSMSDIILSNCLSAAICHTATKFKGISVEGFYLYCHTTITHLWCSGPIEFWGSSCIFFY